MYHRVRKKMSRIIISAILLLVHPLSTSSRTIETTTTVAVPDDEGFDNNIIDFDEEYTVKFNKKYGTVPWHANDFNKNTHRYTLIRDNDNNNNNRSNVRYDPNNTKNNRREETTTEDFRVIPLELLSTTEDMLISIIESTAEPDLTVIPLTTTVKLPSIKIEQTVTLPTTAEYDISTENYETTTDINEQLISTMKDSNEEFTTTTREPVHLNSHKENVTTPNTTRANTVASKIGKKNNVQKTTTFPTVESKAVDGNVTTKLNTNIFSKSTSSKDENRRTTDVKSKDEETDVSIFTELDTGDLEDIPEDYYDSKDVLPTSAPKTDAISVLFGLAGSVVGSVVESVAEKVVPKSIYDLFKRMQRQNEALEAERLRSREENGGLGQFGRGILKSLSTGLSKPLSQLMAGVQEAGSLDTDRGFVGSVASSVTSVANVANNYLEAFKDKVQAIYPGTVWCGDGHSAQARSSTDLGLFFFTDTCCRQHDACKIYIKAGETKYGLTNTGLFTRSHCSCDAKFRACLRRTNSLVSAQIGLTYFNVLGPQCFRRAHPIVKCAKRTRITGQKCEEYEMDYSKPKMWQWFDNETF